MSNIQGYYKGDDIIFNDKYTANWEPVNLTWSTINYSVSSSKNKSDIIASWVAEITDAINWEFKIHIQDTDTSTFPVWKVTLQVRIQDSAEIKLTILDQEIEIHDSLL